MPTTRHSTQEELLDLIVKKADALRAVGVLHVELAGCSFVLSPVEPAAPVVQADEAQVVEESDPFNDPATYGRSDGKVPGFKRRAPDDDGDN